MSRFLSLLLLGVLALFACAPPLETDLGESKAPIVDGTATSGDRPEVVSVANRFGLCTGTIIAPRVVLTAKHCVQDDGSSAEPYDATLFAVGVGDYVYGQSETYYVSDVWTTPGTYTEGLNGLIGVDIALLTLSTGTRIEPAGIFRGDPEDLIGEDVTAIGYGQVPDGRSGRKYFTTTTITGVRNGNYLTPPAICQGDSGGPLLTADNEVAGISSWGSGSCGSGVNGYNTIDQYLDMIDMVIGQSGSCVDDMDGVEHCDGFDNDCNEEVDEICVAVGEPCSEVENCVGGEEGGLLCDSAGGTTAICTTTCDPMRPLVGCPTGTFCARTDGCAGLCRLGEPGDKQNDEPCEDDTECESLTCLDPGDGNQRCLEPCTGNAGMCPAGEVCAALPNQCAGCVPEEIVIGDRGLGENCDADEDCRSDSCHSELGQSYCTDSCESDGDCGLRFHCREDADGDNGICVRGTREGIGSGCVNARDCAAGQGCATDDGVSWCTIGDCEVGGPAFPDEDADCPENFECIEIEDAQVCAPLLGLPGEECADNSECLSGLCEVVNDVSVCTRYCGRDAPCSPGYECQRLSDGQDPICVQTFEPVEEASSGGCRVGTSPSSEVIAWLVGIGLLLVWGRRRG